MAEKARLSHKEAKQPDEFITLTHQAIAWGRSHQQLVVAAGIGAVLLIAALGVATAYRAAQRRDANAALAQAQAKLSASDFAGAAAELTAVSERWSNTAVAPLASLLAADSAIRAGEVDKALASLAQLPRAAFPLYLQQRVLVTWGVALERKQQWAEAAAKYREAAAIPGPFSGAAVVGEARTVELAGDPTKAREIYRQAYEQFPDLPGRELLATKFAAS